MLESLMSSVCDRDRGRRLVKKELTRFFRRRNIC